MTGKVEATIYVCWDENGVVTAHAEAEEAAALLEEATQGLYRRAAAINLSLPCADPIEMAIEVPEAG